MSPSRDLPPAVVVGLGDPSLERQVLARSGWPVLAWTRRTPGPRSRCRTARG